MHKAPEAGNVKMKIVLPKDTFAEILADALGKSQVAKLHTERCQAELNKAKTVEAECGQVVTRLMRIQEFAKWNYNPMEWHRADGGALLDNTDWRSIERLETSMLYAEIATHRRTDLKKMKHHVTIKVWKRDLSEDYRTLNGGYIDYKYGLNKYGEHAMDCKFSSLEQAESYMKAWQGEFYDDHKAEIDFDRLMRTRAQREI